MVWFIQCFSCGIIELYYVVIYIILSVCSSLTHVGNLQLWFISSEPVFLIMWKLLTAVHVVHYVHDFPCISKRLCHCYFFNNFAKHWLILIILACSIMNKIDVSDCSFAHLTLIVLVYYFVKCRSCNLAIYSNWFILRSSGLLYQYRCGGTLVWPWCWWFWAPCCVIWELKMGEHFGLKTRGGGTAFPRIPLPIL